MLSLSKIPNTIFATFSNIILEDNKPTVGIVKALKKQQNQIKNKTKNCIESPFELDFITIIAK